MLAATQRSAPPRDAHAQRVSADELAAAVDALWHQDDRGVCLHPVLHAEGPRVEYFTRCRVDPRLGWLGGRLRAEVFVRPERASWGLTVSGAALSPYDLMLGRAYFDTERAAWLWLASDTPPPPAPLALACEDPFDPAAWEAFIRRQVLLGRKRRGVPSPTARALLALGTTFTRSALRAAYRRSALAAHPDRGGSAARFVAVREAFEALLPFAEGDPA